MTTKEPEGLEKRHLKYLDTIRDTGEVNMFHGATYLIRKFGMPKDQAVLILKYWMKTYGVER